MDTATEESEEENVTLFNKRLIKLFGKARIQNGIVISVRYVISSTILIFVLVLPTLLQDIIDGADNWGDEGKIDPFTEIYDVSLLGNAHFGGLVLTFRLSARFRHDRPYGHLS